MEGSSIGGPEDYLTITDSNNVTRSDINGEDLNALENQASPVVLRNDDTFTVHHVSPNDTLDGISIRYEYTYQLTRITQI